MKKTADFLIDRRHILLAVMLVLTAVCVFLTLKVPVNKDRTKYLADDSGMKHGISVIHSDFPEEAEKSSVRVMFDNLSAKEIPEIKARLEAIPNVSSVAYEPDSADYNRDNHTLFIVRSQFDYATDEEKAIEDAIAREFSGYAAACRNDDVPATDVPFRLITIVFLFGIVVLTLMSHSWLDPVLFLTTIAVAVVINMGTNIVLPHIDELTTAIGPILQFVLSMDYSIILMSRYRQEKSRNADKIEAMKNALSGSVSSIASSSLTTVAGLLALVFLSFKLGPELGIVLAKGVFISMLCVFTVLPVMILAFDSLLTKTSKRAPQIPMGLFAKFSHRVRFVMPFVFAFLLVGSFVLQSSAVISFTEKSDDPIADIFPKDNTVVVIYRSDDEEKLPAVIGELAMDTKIRSIFGYSNTLGQALSAEEMSKALAAYGGGAAIDESMVKMLYLLCGGTGEPASQMSIPELFDFLCDDLFTDVRYAGFIDEATKAAVTAGRAELADAVRQMRGDTYSRLVLNTGYADESPETYEFIDNLNRLCRESLREYYLVGNSVMVSEMNASFAEEYPIITLITAVSVFLVVLIAFRRPTLPLLLTLLVQCGVFITVATFGAYSGAIYYLALLVVQSILMGATIDYGIVFCNFYLDSRKTDDVKTSLKTAYERSIHTIMTSGAILVFCLASLGIFAEAAMVSEVCITLFLGVVVALLLILFVLPGLVACCDRLIVGRISPENDSGLNI